MRSAEPVTVKSTIVLFLLALAALPSSARAFPTGSQFDSDPISSAGGGGVHFTGGPGFPLGTCSSCHQDGPQRVGVVLEADDPSLFSAGYAPRHLYRMRVVLQGEGRGLDFNGPARCGGDSADTFVPCNSNGFALEVDDSLSQTAGSLCPSPPTAPSGGKGPGCERARGAVTFASMDGTTIHSTGYLEKDTTNKIDAGYENGATSWDFYWTAPPAGTGPVTFHVGAVDGNGGLGTYDVPQDLLGDDTAQAHIDVGEAGGVPLVASTAGCTVGARSASLGGAAFMIAGALGALATRKNKRRTRRTR
jgi:hypothetical protein